MNKYYATAIEFVIFLMSVFCNGSILDISSIARACKSVMDSQLGARIRNGQVQHVASDSSHTDDFRYPPLNTEQQSIRLLTVFTELSVSGRVQCHLDLATSNQTRHTALSYVWGTDPPSRIIEINAQPFLIKENLWQFLEAHRQRAGGQVRRRCPSKTDSVCLIQSSDICSLCGCV
jgi:hypothetical protein